MLNGAFIAISIYGDKNNHRLGDLDNGIWVVVAARLYVNVDREAGAPSPNETRIKADNVTDKNWLFEFDLLHGDSDCSMACVVSRFNRRGQVDLGQ